MSYYIDKQEVDTQTDTHTQTQAMTMPIGQKASGKNETSPSLLICGVFLMLFGRNWP